MCLAIIINIKEMYYCTFNKKILKKLFMNNQKIRNNEMIKYRHTFHELNFLPLAGTFISIIPQISMIEFLAYSDL